MSYSIDLHYYDTLCLYVLFYFSLSHHHSFHLLLSTLEKVYMTTLHFLAHFIFSLYADIIPASFDTHTFFIPINSEYFLSARI